MSDQAVVTDVPENGPPPIYDTDHLRRRIDVLKDQAKAELAELWSANGLGGLEGMVTAEQYMAMERLVNNCEPTAPESHAGALQEMANALYALPEHIRAAATAALEVYAGMDDPRRWLLTSTGRLGECARIISEAQLYAEGLATAEVPSVTELPVADDTREQVASSEYPGTKADAKTVLAWVGEDRNRAARAYAHEQERSTVRKGVTKKLKAVLGEDGLAAVTEAMAAAAPPPLDLSAVPPAVGATPTASAEQKGAVGPTPLSVEGSGVAPTVEPAPTAPALSSITEVEDRVAQALRQIGKGFLELAEAIA